MTTMTLYKKFSSIVLGACFISMLVSCGNNVATGGGEAEKNPFQEQEQNDNNGSGEGKEELGLVGTYSVDFDSFNSDLSGYILATGKFEVMGDLFSSTIDLRYANPMVTHYQFIYEGTECPSLKHDTNDDGYIDPIEASKILGKVLIPLDNDLNSQLGGLNTFPMTSHFNSYLYTREGSLSSLESDLKAPDLNLRDGLKKLAPGEELKLEGKVVVIHGISRDTYPSGSIQIAEGTSVFETLPVACGKIVRNIIPESTTTGPE